MLYEQAEQKEIEDCGGITTVTGTCRFCGQMAAHKALAEWGQNEADELAAETCKCVDARIYSRKKRRKEKADAQIELLFGEDNFEKKLLFRQEEMEA